MAKVTLETLEGVTLGVDRYNKLIDAERRCYLSANGIVLNFVNGLRETGLVVNPETLLGNIADAVVLLTDVPNFNRVDAPTIQTAGGELWNRKMTVKDAGFVQGQRFWVVR